MAHTTHLEGEDLTEAISYAPPSTLRSLVAALCSDRELSHRARDLTITFLEPPDPSSSDEGSSGRILRKRKPAEIKLCRRCDGTFTAGEGGKCYYHPGQSFPTFVSTIKCLSYCPTLAEESVVDWNGGA